MYRPAGASGGGRRKRKAVSSLVLFPPCIAILFFCLSAGYMDRPPHFILNLRFFHAKIWKKEMKKATPGDGNGFFLFMKMLR
jgi:hypothetical protein